MIIQTIQTSKIVQKKMYYKPMDDGQVRYSRIDNDYGNYSHRKPILGLQNQKRLSNNQLKPDNFEQLQTKSDMSRSNLSRINEELEERTRYFAQHGKYDSKWQPEHYDYFRPDLNIRLRQRESNQNSNKSDKQFGYTASPNHRESQVYQPTNFGVDQNNYKYYQPRNNTDYKINFNQQKRDQSYHSNNFYDLNRSSDYYDMNDPKDALKYHAQQSKNAAIENARQVKNQVKQNIKGNFMEAVGPDNYQNLSIIKNSAGQIKDNAVQNVKDVANNVAGTVKAATGVVVDGVVQAKDAAKQTASEATKAVVGEQNFNIMRFIKHSVGQIKDNVLGTKSQAKKQIKNDQKGVKQANHSNNSIKKPNSINQVSPIQYSQRSFSKAPSQSFSFFWIYGLIAIGFFLVIFQSLK